MMLCASLLAAALPGGWGGGGVLVPDTAQAGQQSCDSAPALLQRSNATGALPQLPAAVAARLRDHAQGKHSYAALVYRLDRQEGFRQEVRTMYNSIRAHDASAAFTWIVHVSDVPEMRAWGLARVELLPITDADLCAVRDALHVPRLTHHSGSQLVWLKLLLPTLLPAPFMLVDTDTIALPDLAQVGMLYWRSRRMAPRQ